MTGPTGGLTETYVDGVKSLTDRISARSGAGGANKGTFAGLPTWLKWML